MRRIFIASLLSFFFAASSVHAENASAPLQRILPYLVEYVELPPDEKTHFKIAHRVSSKGTMSDPIRLWIEEGDQTIELPVGDDGQVDWTPIVGLLDANLMLHTNIPKGQGSVSLDVNPILTATPEIALTDMILAINQANRSIKANAGALGFLAPKMKALFFIVPEGTSATIIDAAGVQTPLDKNDDGQFVVKPKKHPFKGANSVIFSAPPIQIGFVD